MFAVRPSGTGLGPAMALLLVVVAAAGCGPREVDPRCSARDDLRRAVSLVNLASSSYAAGDLVATQQHLDDVALLVRSARARLASLDPGVRAGATGRRLDEAANYLGFIVAEFRAGGTPDFSLAHFASRDLSRAAPGLSRDAPFTC